MGGQRGRDVLIAIGDGGEPELFFAVAGIRARTIALSSRLVDATTAQSTQAWRELIAGAATKRIEVAGSGMFWGAPADERVRGAYFAGETPSMRLVIPGFGTLQGPFAIAELTYGGEQDGEATFSIRLMSAGAIAFEAL
jgi:TP901-1 family phage major tail protein